MSKDKKPLPDEVLYNKNLRAPIQTEINPSPKARVHQREWAKIMNGDPVEINPSVGSGYGPTGMNGPTPGNKCVTTSRCFSHVRSREKSTLSPSESYKLEFSSYVLLNFNGKGLLGTNLLKHQYLLDLAHFLLPQLSLAV